MQTLNVVLGLTAMLAFVAALVSAVACSITRRARVARFARAAGFSALALGLLSLVTGAVQASAAMSAPGLMQTDRQRLLSNAIAESLYNVALTAFASAPALLASWRVLRKASAGSES